MNTRRSSAVLLPLILRLPVEILLIIVSKLDLRQVIILRQVPTLESNSQLDSEDLNAQSVSDMHKTV